MSKQHLVLIVISTYCLVASCTNSQSINPSWQQQKEQPSTETAVTSEVPKGPNRLFLQQVSSSSAIIKWRGDQNEVWYGTKRNDLSARKSAEQERNHKLVVLDDLKPDTRYY
ncbi:MAG: fibronectin type III domain-containing protein, partial [Pseudomonadales bacterium]|nr:fibronectin type III domain-containing protein [Pseudomonadales bacterium]